MVSQDHASPQPSEELTRRAAWFVDYSEPSDLRTGEDLKEDAVVPVQDSRAGYLSVRDKIKNSGFQAQAPGILIQKAQKSACFRSSQVISQPL